jgi:hypothetical protein
VNQLTLLVCCTFLLLTLFSANSGAVEAEHPVIKLEPQHTDHTDAALVIKAPIPQKGESTYYNLPERFFTNLMQVILVAD